MSLKARKMQRPKGKEGTPTREKRRREKDWRGGGEGERERKGGNRKSDKKVMGKEALSQKTRFSGYFTCYPASY